MNVVAYIYLTITKLSRRTLCVPLRRSPLNEIHARLITCSGRTEDREEEYYVSSTFFQYEENNERDCFTNECININATISATMLEQRGNQFFLASTFPRPSPSFQFFSTPWRKKMSMYDRSSKSEQRINANLARMNRAA